MAIESTGAQQCRIQNLWPVGGGHENHAHFRVKAVHLDEKLVQGLFPLVMASEVAETPGLSKSVQLVDENDARCFLFCLHKKIPHSRSAKPYKHLDELGTAQAEKGHMAFPCHGFCQKGLPCSRRTDEQ